MDIPAKVAPPHVESAQADLSPVPVLTQVPIPPSPLCHEIPSLAEAIARAPVPSRAFQETMRSRFLSMFEEIADAPSGRMVGNPLPPPPPLPHQPDRQNVISNDIQSLLLFDDDLDLAKLESV